MPALNSTAALSCDVTTFETARRSCCLRWRVVLWRRGEVWLVMSERARRVTGAIRVGGDSLVSC